MFTGLTHLRLGYGGVYPSGIAIAMQRGSPYKDAFNRMWVLLYIDKTFFVAITFSFPISEYEDWTSLASTKSGFTTRERCSRPGFRSTRAKSRWFCLLSSKLFSKKTVLSLTDSNDLGRSRQAGKSKGGPRNVPASPSRRFSSAHVWDRLSHGHFYIWTIESG